MAVTKTFILHIKGPDSSQDFTVPLGTTVIGREAGVGLQLPFPLVSRKHAQLECSEDHCTVMDLGSANGTLLNTHPLPPQTPTPLAQGDLLGIGPFEMNCEVLVTEAAPPPPPAEPVLEPEPEVKPEAVPEEKPAPVKPEKPPSAEKAPRAGKETLKEPPERAPKPPPPSIPAAPPPGVELPPAPDPSILPVGQLPPGLSMQSYLLLPNLPGIYHTNFMSRFLALFEATELPLMWTIDHFNLFLSPGTSPQAFLPWLANWFEIVFDATWSEDQRRTLLKEAGAIYSRRGTRWALGRVLEIYLGQPPEIVEFQDAKDPYTFTVKLPVRLGQVSRELLVQMIDASKPAHTNYNLEFRT
ncbi:MAG: phage tail protein I [Anaerolineales bacterium]|jgi:phage tail-like protein|nr:phage tail protein I [Anaerolineales bacterium]